jgi:hypothetical protein
MAYTTINFKTKKALKEALASGKKLTCFQPGPFADQITTTGTIYLEGPHYPEPHKWYAQAKVEKGIIVNIK